MSQPTLHQKLVKEIGDRVRDYLASDKVPARDFQRVTQGVLHAADVTDINQHTIDAWEHVTGDEWECLGDHEGDEFKRIEGQHDIANEALTECCDTNWGWNGKGRSV